MPLLAPEGRESSVLDCPGRWQAGWSSDLGRPLAERGLISGGGGLSDGVGSA